MAETPKYRYPGINSFEADDTDIFFGRDEDRRRLADLVEVEKNTLLYSRSGLGKSSLLKAALLPELTRRGYQAFYIRLGLYQPESLPPVLNVLRRSVLLEQKTAPTTFLRKFSNRTNTLWSIFKAFQIATYPNDKPVVLIFDQFEEISSYHNHLKDFKAQLADLLYTPIPQNYLEALTDDDLLDEPLTNEEIELLYKPLRVKAVFAIRSDQLNVVNELSDYLPNILKIYYELKPLSAGQARRAIEEPGKKQGAFITSPFTYEPGAVDKIIGSLDQKRKNEIDTVQLQILLQYVEQDTVERGKVTSIAASDLGDLNNVYKNYYYNSLLKLEDNEERQAAEELIEDTLIAEGRRVAYDEALFRKRVSAATLDTLLKVRLLRKEPNSMGGYSYEISHDSLVDPILQTREERKQKEVVAAQRSAFAKRLERQRLKAHQQRKIIYTAIAAFIIASGFAIWALYEKRKADKANGLAQEHLVKADKLISALFFYDNKFAVTKSKVKGLSSQVDFYFIDTLGNKIEAFKTKWRNAEPFNYENGLAKVRDEYAVDKFLDTNGHTYPISYDADKLTRSSQALDLSDKKIVEFPPQIAKNEQLGIIKLNGIGKKMDLSGIVNLNEPKYLSLINCGMEDIPTGISRKSSLIYLDVSNNQIKIFPPVLDSLKNLSILKLNDNRLQSLPTQIDRLQKLTQLELSNNQLILLPKQLFSLKDLTVLNFNHNQISVLPGLVGNLKKLTILGAKDNQLTNIPVEIGTLYNLQGLGLDSNKLTTIPVQICNLTKLVGLGLAGNQLSTLPPEIKNLQQLFTLLLNDNRITSLPSQIGNLTSLTELYLHYNQLKNVPPQFENLQNLEVLHLTGNPLRTVPTAITRLLKLQTLGLADAQLEKIPADVGKLTSLTRLDLSYNNLTTLPDAIRNLKSLQELSLEGNPFSEAEKARIRQLLPTCNINF